MSTAFSKPFFLHHRRHLLLPCRLLSFSTPEEAAAERRRRKRRLRIEPPINSLRTQQPRPLPSSKTGPNPNTPKLPEPVSAVSGPRLALHNRVLSMLREHRHEDAVLHVRHSVYSNCRPTIHTANAVLSHLLRHARYADMLSLHRFITQAGISPNLTTYNLILQAYCDARKIDTALEIFKTMLKDAPFSPSPTTYRILTRALVENSHVDRAVELSREMQEKGHAAVDHTVFNNVMRGLIENGKYDEAVEVFGELRSKARFLDGGVYGTLMECYFRKGMEGEALRVYEEFLGLDYKVSVISYNSVLDTLVKNGKFEREAIELFNSMKGIHNPPLRIAVNLGSFNVIVDGHCSVGRFEDAVNVFKNMAEQKCQPDTLSYNNLIANLCKSGLVAKGEELYGEMLEIEFAKPDELTHILLVDACFEAKRPDDAIRYFSKMIERELRPNVSAYNKLFQWLFAESRVVDVKRFSEQMVVERELKPDSDCYGLMLKGYSEAGDLEEMLSIAAKMLEDGTGLTGDNLEYVKETLRTEGKESELQRLYDEQAEKERLAKEKAEQAKKERERVEMEKAEREKAERERANEALTKLLARHRKQEGVDEEESDDVNGDLVENSASDELWEKEKGSETHLGTTQPERNSNVGCVQEAEILDREAKN